MKQAYVAGNYTAPTPEGVLVNIRATLREGLDLAAEGYAPIIPHTMGPHRITWSEAMETCRALVRALDPSRGDILVLLPGWETSRGAREERELALSLGIPVRRSRRS